MKKIYTKKIVKKSRAGFRAQFTTRFTAGFTAQFRAERSKNFLERITWRFFARNQTFCGKLYREAANQNMNLLWIFSEKYLSKARV